jgi:hypothetical protein
LRIVLSPSFFTQYAVVWVVAMCDADMVCGLRTGVGVAERMTLRFVMGGRHAEWVGCSG